VRLIRSSSQSRRAAAIYIDIALVLVLLLLFSPRLTGLPLHEWLGIALGLPLLVHLLLSWSWIRAATARVATRTSGRARANYVLNWLLFILVVIEVLSGIVISNVALPAIGVPTINDRAWRALHNQTLNVTMLLIGIHVGMNWRLFATRVRRFFRADAGVRADVP
jgi:cytochrome b